MLKYKFSKAIVYTATLALLFSLGTFTGKTLSENKNSEFMLTEPAYSFDGIDDIINNHSSVFTVEVISKSEPYGVGPGMIKIEDKLIDTNEYFVDSVVRVTQVLKGETQVLGKEITVVEYIGPSPTFNNDYLTKVESKYLMFLKSDNSDEKGIIYYQTDPKYTLYTINAKNQVSKVSPVNAMKSSINFSGKSLEEVARIINNK